MGDSAEIRAVLEVIRRHVERAAAGTGMQASTMTVDLRFGLRSDGRSKVRPVLRTSEGSTDGAPHSLRMTLSLADGGPAGER